MYHLVNSINQRYNPSFESKKDPCKITTVAIAAMATLCIGAATWCAMFFTTSLSTPSIVGSVSIVVLLSGIDIALIICFKKKQSNKYESIDLPSKEVRSNEIEDTKIEETIDSPDVAFKKRLQPYFEECSFKYSDEQMSWLRMQFEQLERSDSNDSPLQEYLFAAAQYPLVEKKGQEFGIFYFFFKNNLVAANISLAVLNEQNLQVEQFVFILHAFILSSKKNFYISKKRFIEYPFNELKIMHVPKINGQEKLQIQFHLELIVALQQTL